MKLEEAIVADCGGRIQEAAAGYEEVLRQDPDNLTALVNLVAVYWQSTDFGFSTGNKLASEFVFSAGRRLLELLDSALARFPDSPEVNFWASYIGWTDFGKQFDLDVFRTLLRENPEYLEPAMAMYMWSHGNDAKSEALRLLQRCRATPTTRCQYVASLIDAVIPRPSQR